MYAPFNFDQINLCYGTYTPSQYKKKNNAAFMYWQRSLYQRMESLFKFELPDTWKGDAKEFFTFCLYRFGHVGCFESEKYGFTFQPGAPGGQGWFYQPTWYMVSNPDFNSQLIIGQDVEVIKLTSDYYGTFDIINRYAEILADMDTSLSMAIENTRLSWVLGAKNKGIAETLKKIYDRIMSGQSLVIYDKAIFNDKQDSNDPTPFQFLERKDIKNSYIVDMLLKDIQNIIMEFDSEVGLPTVPYQKKERMVTDEANMKVKDGQARYESWFENLSDTIEVVNNHFGSSIKVEKRYDTELEVMDNEPVQNNA